MKFVLLIFLFSSFLIPLYGQKSIIDSSAIINWPIMGNSPLSVTTETTFYTQLNTIWMIMYPHTKDVSCTEH